jgi:twitching motility protein PilU
MERDQASKFINDLLKLMVSRNGSDLFITAEFPPAIKVDGKVTKVSPQPLTGTHTLTLARAVMSDKQVADFERTKECNFAISPAGIGRFRVNAFIQQGKVGMVLRTIPLTLPTIDGLGVPQVLKEVTMTKRGLCILVGATGSGKSTTLAAMVDWRNENSFGHIITVEDPVEFVHPHKNCVVTQREVGPGHRQLGSGAQEHAAPGARRDPDGRNPRPRNHGTRRGVCRNRPSVPGHTARQQRQPGAGPDHQLLPRRAPRPVADGPFAEPARHGVAAAHPQAGRQGPGCGGGNHAQHPADSDLIFKGEVAEIKEIMKKSRNLGMQTFDQALFDAYEANVISYEDALRNADSLNDLRLQIKLNSQRAKSPDLASGTEHFAIV